MPITKQDILEQLERITDLEPDQIKRLAWCDGAVQVVIEVIGDDAQQQRMRQQVKTAIGALGPEVRQIAIEVATPHGQESAPGSNQPMAADGNPLPNVRQIVAVGAGKGGVGKSTIAVNLAVGLARQGATVGLLDGDIYGPSIPTMLGINHLEVQSRADRFLPFEAHGIKTISIGCLVEDDKPLIWRGPMAHGAFRQLATQTNWGPLDFLVIDLPPGTGDVPLTMSQLLPLTGAVIVCTPQKVAQDDAIRALAMFRQLGVQVLGVVENMSYFVGNDLVEYDIFGRGGAQFMAEQQSVPFLGGIPINMRLRQNCDAGNPTANFEGQDPLATALPALVAHFQTQVQANQGQAKPTISVH